ncbi:MAG: hypothetical protein U0X73_05635 [Thermoanaerobaculia bacterium]
MSRALRGIVLLLALSFAPSSDASAETAPSPPPSPPLLAEHARALTDVRFEPTAARVERGRYLASAAIGCVICHSERDPQRPGRPPIPGREFAGAVLSDEPGYRLVAPNLTPDPETGAGTWSDDMLARAIREGVGHDGRGIGGPMWWWAFRSLSDEDLASIVVYLRSLPPVRHLLPPRILSAEAERQRSAAARPLEQAVPAPDLGDPLARGRYLLGIADCAGCHSAWEAPVNAGIFAGGNEVGRFGQPVFSANLTPDASGLGGRTAPIFIGILRGGRGGTLDPTMPWAAYRGMTDADLEAIFLALSQLEPVRHFVNNLDPPTACPVCGQTHGLGELNRPPVYERVAVDLGPLADYAGTYRFEDFEMAIAAHDGALFVTDPERPEIELVPVAGGRFQGRGLAAAISFERDAGGRIVALVSHELPEIRGTKAP